MDRVRTARRRTMQTIAYIAIHIATVQYCCEQVLRFCAMYYAVLFVDGKRSGRPRGTGTKTKLEGEQNRRDRERKSERGGGALEDGFTHFSTRSSSAGG